MPKEWLWLLVGVVIGAYVIPMVSGMISGKGKGRKAAS